MKNTTTIMKMLGIALMVMSQAAFGQKLPTTGECPIGQNCFTVNITPAGQKVKLRLPKDIRTGDAITGSVIEDNIPAKGVNNKTSSTLEGMVIEIDGKQTRLSDKMVSFIVPAGVASLPFIFKNAAGSTIETGQIPVGTSMNDLLSDLWWRDPIGGQYNIPPVAQPGQSLSIPGKFDGDASNTKVTLNGKPVGIIAESPRQAFVEIPNETTAGTFEMKIEEKSNRETSRINIIDLDMSAKKLSLRKGEKTTIHVAVSGLEGLDLSNGNTLNLTLENNSPQTVVFPGEPGNVIIKEINAESVRDGIYEYSTRIEGVTTGGFSITSTVAAPRDDNACVKKYQDCMAQVKTSKDAAIKKCQDAGGDGLGDCLLRADNAAADLAKVCLDDFLKCRKK